MGANVAPGDFFRLHRSGKPVMRNNRRVAQTIVAFRNWDARTRAFDTRFVGSLEERKARPYYVRPDLTKRRRDLLYGATTRLENIHMPTLT